MNYRGLAVVSVVVWCESYKVVEFGVGWQQQQPHAQRGAEAQGAPSTQHPAPCTLQPPTPSLRPLGSQPAGGQSRGPAGWDSPS